jgi:hypothetical protein
MTAPAASVPASITAAETARLLPLKIMLSVSPLLPVPIRHDRRFTKEYGDGLQRAVGRHDAGRFDRLAVLVALRVIGRTP